MSETNDDSKVFGFILIFFGIIAIILLFKQDNFGLSNDQKVIQYYQEISISKDVAITYYNTGDLTYIEEKPYEGSIAISGNLYQYFYPGEIVYLNCDNCILQGYYRINDKVNKRINNRVDVYTNKNIDLSQGIWLGKIEKIDLHVKPI